MGGGFGALLGERRRRGGRIDEGDEGWLGAGRCYKMSTRLTKFKTSEFTQFPLSNIGKSLNLLTAAVTDTVWWVPNPARAR